jgi:plastocyanin
VVRSVLAAVALVAGACGGSGATTADGGAARRVLVDYKHDEFAASFLAYFPNEVTVHPGDRVDFKQAWTGEPHTVTMGRLVDDLGKPFWDLLDPVFDRGDGDYSPLIGAEKPSAQEFTSKLPFLWNDELVVQQAAAQPCYLRSGVPDVSDPSKPCAVQEQPAFDGSYDYYNSGFIAYGGEAGNTFSIPLADDVPPGTYHYYCNYHFIEMSGAVKVVPKSQPIPSQSDVNRAANRQATRATSVLATMFDDARAGRRGKLPVVGVEATHEEQDQRYGVLSAIGDEFLPSTIEAKPNTKVTWTFVGGSHSIAFNVSKYFPVFAVRPGGDVYVDVRGYRATGFPIPPDQAAFDAGTTGPRAAAPRDPVNIDGGRFDGSGGLRSTGTFYAAGDTFSLTFTKPGTYAFACVIHPAMVGRVVVR